MFKLLSKTTTKVGAKTVFTPVRTLLTAQGGSLYEQKTLTGPRILVTGSSGQVGCDLVAELRRRYGVSNVIATDVKLPPKNFSEGPFEYLDVMDYNAMAKMVIDNNITWVVHLASMLSAVGERNPQAAMKLNTTGIENVLELARINNLRVFAPSTIAVFGESTPRVMTPDSTIMRPSTMYGVTKVYLELLGEYYRKKFGTDFRSVRLPGVLGGGVGGGGTTDWAIDIYHEALLKGKYTCFVKEDTEMPMMYAPDAIKAIVNLLAAPAEKLTQSTYNVTGCSFTPKMVAESIKKRLPEFELTCQPDFRQAIADSWPKSIDDSIAAKDWDWKPTFDLEAMTDDMLVSLNKEYNLNKKLNI